MTWTKKYENRSDEPRRAHGELNQGKVVITGFHSETSKSEVIQLLKESITEIGMTIENARVECTAKPITHAFNHFKNDDERNTYIRSANMLKRELRGRRLKITRSIDAEERFQQKTMVYVKYCTHVKHNVPLDSKTTNWTLKKRTSNTKTLKQKSKVKWKNGNQKTHRNDCKQSRERGQKTKRRRKDCECSNTNNEATEAQVKEAAGISSKKMHSSAIIEEMVRELEGYRWDAILLSETWRQDKSEMWETHDKHIFMETQENTTTNTA